MGVKWLDGINDHGFQVDVEEVNGRKNLGC